MSKNISYLVPAKTVSCTQEIKRSKFITTIGRATDPETARKFVRDISSKYPDASHNCYAFITGNPHSSPDIGMGDDGEVSGTAGKPMLNVLQHKEIGEIVAVVSRYFGGVKLGPGGLVRAYTSSIQQALVELELAEYVELKKAVIEIDFQYENAVRQALKKAGIETGDASYNDSVIFNVEIPADLYDKLIEDIKNQTRGNVRFTLK
jgi:uncharacterized YigZ family protein